MNRHFKEAEELTPAANAVVCHGCSDHQFSAILDENVQIR